MYFPKHKIRTLWSIKSKYKNKETKCKSLIVIALYTRLVHLPDTVAVYHLVDTVGVLHIAIVLMVVVVVLLAVPPLQFVTVSFS